MFENLDMTLNFLVLVFGLVEFAKKFGIKGEKLTALSMGIGVVLGVVYKLSLEYTIVAEWFETLMFGVAVGLAASGIYDFAKKQLKSE